VVLVVAVLVRLVQTVLMELQIWVVAVAEEIGIEQKMVVQAAQVL
jgi:hypothetical protein